MVLRALTRQRYIVDAERSETDSDVVAEVYIFPRITDDIDAPISMSYAVAPETVDHVNVAFVSLIGAPFVGDCCVGVVNGVVALMEEK